MKTVLVTGSNGFIGKNLLESLGRDPNCRILKYDVGNEAEDLEQFALAADFIYHFAGVNRPADPDDFMRGNADLTKTLCGILAKNGKKTGIAYTSSVYAEQYESFKDKPAGRLYYLYGLSKKQAENHLDDYARNTGAPVHISRLINAFGKWARPHYNTVIATFCHNISHDLPIQITDRNKMMSFNYIDDIVAEFIKLPEVSTGTAGARYFEVPNVYSCTLGDLADRLMLIHAIRKSLVVPDFADPFNRALYATYLSTVEPDRVSYPLVKKEDERGWLVELIKSRNTGQFFISTTRKGITRGNHYHNTKIEKFIVIRGRAEIWLRQICGDKVERIEVSDAKMQVVDIPPGYTHSITNTGEEDLITLFWADEVFDPDRPDTYFLKV